MKRSRILKNIVGKNHEYKRGQIVNLTDGVAANYFSAGHAMAEMPSPSGVIVTALNNAGYTEMTIGPSGYGFAGPSGTTIHDPPEAGGYYFEGDNTILNIVFPGEVHERFEILALKPRS